MKINPQKYKLQKKKTKTQQETKHNKKQNSGLAIDIWFKN